jgi:hypothetical protein
MVAQEGFKQYLQKAFLHDIKTCPYLDRNCLETKCEKFIIVNRGKIKEGGCADAYVPTLLIDLKERLNASRT